MDIPELPLFDMFWERGIFLKKWIDWFQNHSLRFKMVSLLFVVVVILQVLNGCICISLVSGKFEETISQANLATVRQMSLNLNRAMTDIVKEMVPIREKIMNHQVSANREISFNDYISRNITYQEQFNSMIAENENYQFIHSMIILDEAGKENYVFCKDEYLILKNENIFQKVLNDNELTKFCNWGHVVQVDYFFDDTDKEIISIIMPIYQYNNIISLLIVNLEVNAIEKHLERLGDSDHTLFLQLNETDVITKDKGKWEEYREAEQEKIRKSEKWENVENVGNNVIMSSELEMNSWRLSMMVPQSSISSNAGVLSKYIIFVIITTGIVLLFCVSNIVYIVTKPIKKMTEIMEANRHTRQINYRFRAKYRDEVGVLAETYNKLMDEISQLMIDIEKEQIQNRKTYQKMLQMQIKPHFLYNTLEAAKFLVEMGDPNGIEMLTTIGKFYKSSLSNVDEYITVAEEVEHLKYYLKILKLRYSSKYDYAVQVSKEIEKNEMIRFSLQPLVENAIYHGIKQKRKKGFVKVLGYIENQMVHLVVWDNGAGIAEDKLEKIRKQLQSVDREISPDHIGIINVHQRIQVRYGEAYGLAIDSEEGEFTRVEMVLPIKRREE